MLPRARACSEGCRTWRAWIQRLPRSGSDTSGLRTRAEPTAICCAMKAWWNRRAASSAFRTRHRSDGRMTRCSGSPRSRRSWLSRFSSCALFWGVGAMCVAAAGWARHRASELASVLEVSPFALTRVALDGTRLRIPWHHELVLQNQPRHRRVLLATARGSVVIALGYRRLGFERLLRLTIEHGGFTPLPTEQAAGVTGEPPPEERTTS